MEVRRNSRVFLKLFSKKIPKRCQRRYDRISLVFSPYSQLLGRRFHYNSQKIQIHQKYIKKNIGE